MSEQKQPLSALQRLEALEQTVFRLAQASNAVKETLDVVHQRLRQTEVNFNNLDKGANGLTQVLVETGVVSKDVLFKQIEDNVVAEREAIENSWVSSGAAEEVFTVEEGGIIAVSETDSEGKFAALREHVEVSKLNEDVKPVLLGKSVGDAILLPNGNTVTVLRAFKPAELVQGDLSQASEAAVATEIVG